MIKLTNILSEEKKFKARSADTGKIVYYKSKENMDKALDAGEAEPLQKGDEKGAEKDADDGKVKGSDLFKSKETDKVAKASPSTDATIDDYEPDYDGAKFDFDRIFPEDDESIKAFQDIEDKGTVEDMEDYISSYADEELLQRYGIRKPEQIKKLAQKVMAKKVSSTKIDPDDDKAVISFIDKEGKFGPKGAKASVSAWVAKRYGKLDKNNSAYLAWKKMTEGKLTEAKVMGESSSSKLTDIISEKSKGLWANIHARRKSGKRMRKKGEKGAPSDKNFKSASENINAGYEVRKEDYDCFMEYLHGQMQNITEAEYQGRKVKLNKPTRGDSGKFKVYVKNPKGNVVKVNFGAKGKKNRIKKSDPGARASFRARHNCDSPGPKHKARYWSCRNW